jgi:dihydrodipicolinate synthase/N-acetylneuraminate lyase
MVTPFKKNEDLDEKGLRENIGWYIKEGIHGVICNGSTSGRSRNAGGSPRLQLVDAAA